MTSIVIYSLEFAVALAALLTVSAAGCSNAQEESAVAAATTPSVAQAVSPSVTSAADGTAELNGGNVTVNGEQITEITESRGGGGGGGRGGAGGGRGTGQ